MVAFLYTDNRISERGCKNNKKKTLLKLYPQNKILRNKFDQGGKDLYTENYKTLIKETKEDTNQWKDSLCSRIERTLLK